MAMTVGTAAIAVAGDGTISVTGTGMAKDIADAMAAPGGSVHTRVDDLLATITDPAVRAAVLPGIGGLFAQIAKDVATGVINHISTSGRAVISTGTSPGRMPASTAAGTPLAAPASDVLLGIV